MGIIAKTILVVSVAAAGPSFAEVYWSGFLQGLYGAGTDAKNPTGSEYTAAESRMQMRVEHFGDSSEMFGRLDFLWDGAQAAEYDWELREAYIKFKLGDQIDIKAGRQILTWGTGDLIFINDLFAKDYRSFFTGRDDQYLKAPQTAVRLEWYLALATLNLVWSPVFEPNRLPTGSRLSYFNPPAGAIVGTGLGNQFHFDPAGPAAEIENSELSGRLQRQVGSFSTAFYLYRGFYKNPVGAKHQGATGLLPFFPELSVYGISARGPTGGGIFWIEAGFLDSRQDRDGDNPLIENSSVEAMVGFERQIATNLTVNLQWQIDLMRNYSEFRQGSPLEASGNIHLRDEIRHTIASRVTKLLWSENLKLSGFVFASPSDEDLYLRASAEYKQTDETAIALGTNLFAGSHLNTEFGQFQHNDNLYLKLTYGF